MISLTKILYEVLNNYSVEADMFVDPSASHYDITNEIRALRGVTIVTIITPEEYVQKEKVEYTRVKIKFVTRGNPKEDIIKMRKDMLTSDLKTSDMRINGLKNVKFRMETLRRL